MGTSFFVRDKRPFAIRSTALFEDFLHAIAIYYSILPANLPPPILFFLAIRNFLMVAQLPETKFFIIFAGFQRVTEALIRCRGVACRHVN